MKYTGYVIPTNGSGEIVFSFEAPDNANDAQIEAAFYRKLWRSVRIACREDKSVTMKGATFGYKEEEDDL